LNLPPQAQKGKSVKAAWQGLLKWAQAATLRAGPGVRIARRAGGTTISFAAPRQSFSGVFRVSIAGDRATVGVGTVEGIEPTISGVPIGGQFGKPVPTLKLDSGKYDKAGKSWVCVRARVDSESGRIDTKARDAVTIIQSARPHGSDDLGTFAPLAMLRRIDPKKPEIGTAYQIAYWPLRIYRNPTSNRVILAP